MRLVGGVAISILAAVVWAAHIDDRMEDGHHRPLAVTVTPKNARFCSPTPDAPIFTVLVDLHVRFTNESARPVIVAREIHGIVTGRVADDVADGEEGRTRFRFRGSELYSEVDTPSFGARPDPSRCDSRRTGGPSTSGAGPGGASEHLACEKTGCPPH